METKTRKTTSRKPVQDSPAVVDQRADAKPEPATLDQMAAHPVTAPLVAQIESLQERFYASMNGDADLETAYNAAHSDLRTAAEGAVQAISILVDQIHQSENGEFARLIGSVSRWNQKGNGDTSAVCDFTEALNRYRKARKAYRDSRTGNDPLSREIAKLTKSARDVYNIVAR